MQSSYQDEDSILIMLLRKKIMIKIIAKMVIRNGINTMIDSDSSEVSYFVNCLFVCFNVEILCENMFSSTIY